jgi:cytochrome c-type biogenesis protein CcmI
MSVLIPAVLLAVAVVFFVLYPVVAGKEAPTEPEDERLTEAQHRRRTALLALRDVEYDFHSGKLDETDYRTMKKELSAEALAAIDTEEAEWRARDPDEEGRERGATHSGEGAGEPGLLSGEPPRILSGEVEDEIAALRASIREGMVCPHCGHPNPRGSRFCGDCGSALPILRESGGS